MKANAYATWQGSWKEGSGTLSTLGPTLQRQPFSYASRFEGGAGADPEELLAVAHAGCFNQALANNVDMIGLAAESIETAVVVTLDFNDLGRPAISNVHITVSASVPQATEAQFQHCAERARSNCSISKILRCEITMTATLLV